MGILDAVFRKRHPEEERLQNIVDKLTFHPIRVIVSDDEQPEALSLLNEDGRELILISRGLLRHLSEDELYFVLAHEVAHHILGHLYVKFLTFQIKNAIMEAIRPKPSWFDRIFRGKTDSPWWLQIIDVVSQILLNKTILMEEEMEADIKAIELLKIADFPLIGAYRFFRRLQTEESFMDELYSMIDEHPSPGDRLNNLLKHYPELAGNKI